MTQASSCHVSLSHAYPPPASSNFKTSIFTLLSSQILTHKPSHSKVRMMEKAEKSMLEVNIQLPETKVAAEMGTMSGPLVPAKSNRDVHRKTEAAHVVLRMFCLLTSVTALSLMATAKEASTISLYGFNLPVYSKWSFSDSFEYLVGVSAATAVHSLLQLLISGSRFLQKSPVIPSRSHAWLIFAGDQIFAYGMMSAGSAASGVTNLNRTGIRHSALPNFCRPLSVFCNHVAISIAFTFFSCFLLTTSVVLDVVCLCKY